MSKRGSGILLHITSLPAPYGIGDLGPEAYRFADTLAATKQHFWQILPLHPTDLVYGNSPYHSVSAFANNLLLISPELMVQDGLLSKKELEAASDVPKDHVDYPRVTLHKKKLIRAAYENAKKKKDETYEKISVEHAHWLDDFSLFMALKDHFQGKVWSAWPREVRDRHPETLQALRKQLNEKVEMEKFFQYIFLKQWFALKDYCDERNIHIFGDMPIYVEYNSADLWVHPEMFKLDGEKTPSYVAGVPPDYFSETGQLWGNPIYRWDVLKEQKYHWWIQRIKHNLKLFDIVRIDHFRGLVAYWEIPAGEKNAIKGTWVKAPAEDFFSVLLDQCPDASIIAEDLGIITPDVNELMDRCSLPGMKILLFAFNDDPATNPYVPHNHVENCVLYTGTHDNNTARGWFENEATPDVKKKLNQYLGREVSPENIHGELIRLAMMSVARMAIIPMQDILGLGAKARMNQPSTIEGNWKWRLLPDQFTQQLQDTVRDMTEMYGRANDVT